MVLVILISQHSKLALKTLTDTVQLQGYCYGPDFQLYNFDPKEGVPEGFLAYRITDNLGLCFIGATYDTSD